MTQSVTIRSIKLDTELRTMDHRKRNQLLHSMHAHNELAFLIRLLSFSQNAVMEGAIQDHAQCSQMWCVLQLLAGKLCETWNMLKEQFDIYRTSPNQDTIVIGLNAEHQTSLSWLRDYFSPHGLNDKPMVVIRNKTGFHYEGLDVGQPVKFLTVEEKMFYVSDHPVNTLYWVGSAVMFGAIFAEIARLANPEKSRTHAERVQDGFNMLQADVQDANYHIVQVLYGLLTGLLEELFGHPIGAEEISVIENVPTSRSVALCPWIYI